jgi:hypothetical protein
VTKHRFLHQTAVGILTIAVVGVLFPASSAVADPGIWGKNMVGGRVGPWFAEGFTKDIRTLNITVNSASTAFHLEIFYLYNLKGPLYLDLNMGAVSRGDIRIDYVGDAYRTSALGTAGVYPLNVGLQLYPLAVHRRQKLQPFIAAGGSIIIGTETLSYISDTNLGSYLGVSAESREALGWYAGGGLNFVIAESVSLSVLTKYQHAKFSKELVGEKDFSGMQVLVGAAYMYH